METEQRAAILRAMRAWLGIEQNAAAVGIGIAEGTLLAAEKGRACSDKSWARALEYYATRGLHWRAGDDVEPGRILITGAAHPASHP